MDNKDEVIECKNEVIECKNEVIDNKDEIIECNHEFIECKKENTDNTFMCSKCNQDITYMLDSVYIDDTDINCKLKIDSDDLYEVYRCINNNCYSFVYISFDYLNKKEPACKWRYTYSEEYLYLLDKNKNYKTEKNNYRNNYSIIKEIIEEFKINNIYQGYYCFALVPGRGCGGAWDQDIYLYIKSNDLVYRYMLNDSSCHDFDDNSFKNSETILNKEFYNKERQYFKNSLPKI